MAPSAAVAVGAAGAADEDQHGVVSVQPGERPYGHVGALERLDPPDEQQDRPVGGEAERAARAAAVTGGEEGVLDRRRHDLDDAVRVAVEAAELALLLRTAHADGVAAADHLGLGTIAPLRFEVATFRLDAGEGVERRDQRHVEAMLEAVPGDAAEPVVAVDDVDSAAGFDVLGDAVGEHVHLLGERLLG